MLNGSLDENYALDARGMSMYGLHTPPCLHAADNSDGTRYFKDGDDASYTIVWSPGQESFSGVYEGDGQKISINGKPPYVNEGGKAESDNGVFVILLPSGRKKRVRLLFHDRDHKFFGTAGEVIVERCGPPQNGKYVDCSSWQYLKQCDGPGSSVCNVRW
jgi:hypothetical protein